MDLKRFSRRSPGQLLATVGGEKAFVPNPLPPAWTFPGDLWPLLAEVKQEVGILEGVGRLLPDPGLLLRPLEDREAIQSSRLEGTYAVVETFPLAGHEAVYTGALLATSFTDIRNAAAAATENRL